MEEDGSCEHESEYIIALHALHLIELLNRLSFPLSDKDESLFNVIRKHAKRLKGADEVKE